MTRLEKRVFPVIFVIAIIAYVMSIVMRNDDFAQHWLITEDGVLESLTALALLTASLLCAYRCWNLRADRPKTFLLCTAAAAVVLFFGMGEEISWGQRIFGVQSPEFFLAHNSQNETNLHNLVVGETRINKLIFGKILAVCMATYLLTPLAYSKSPRLRRWIDRLAIPIPRLHHVLAILAIVVIVETSQASKRGEINEFALSSLMLMVLIHPHNIAIFRGPKPSDSGAAEPPQTQPQPNLSVPAAENGSRRDAASRRAA